MLNDDDAVGNVNAMLMTRPAPMVHSLQCAWLVWPPGSRGLGSAAVSSGLSVHAGQLSAYSEINILGRHRGSTCVLLNL